ncbi:MAG: hypothetical protein KDC45_14555, partial [Bacteroidetes bacterium]|nr:hypothetical protein [Bacteroidota bacterium]
MMIYSMISIDTECDKDKNWNIPRPLGFENIHSGVQNVLHPVFMETESIPTYLLSPEIILSKACVDTFSGLPGRFELGTHLHSEFIEPESEPEAVGTFQFQGDLPEPIEQAKLTRLTEIFEKAFGYRPTSFRAGRFGIGPRTLRFLADLGYLVDSSVFPLRITPTKNRQNNFYHLDSTAFFPNLDDYSRGSGNSHLLEVPLTVHSDFFLTLPVSLRKWAGSRELLVWAASKALGRNRVKTLTLRPSTNSVKVMRSVVDRHLDYCENENHIFLNMMFHSN